MGTQLELDFMTSECLKKCEDDLLNLLLETSGWVKPSYIQSKIKYFAFDGTTEHNDVGRLRIRHAISRLRLDPNVPYLIISSRLGYKIATKKEARLYATRLKIAGLKKMKKYWAFESKLALDGQLKMMYDGELKETIAHIERLEKEMKE